MQLASAENTGCVRRFDDFFSNCTAMYGRHGCKVDIMAVHYYGCSTTDMQRCRPQVDECGARIDCKSAPDTAEVHALPV